jgi:hypothetical protein
MSYVILLSTKFVEMARVLEQSSHIPALIPEFISPEIVSYDYSQVTTRTEDGENIIEVDKSGTLGTIHLPDSFMDGSFVNSSTFFYSVNNSSSSNVNTRACMELL